MRQTTATLRLDGSFHSVASGAIGKYASLIIEFVILRSYLTRTSNPDPPGVSDPKGACDSAPLAHSRSCIRVVVKSWPIQASTHPTGRHPLLHPSSVNEVC